MRCTFGRPSDCSYARGRESTQQFHNSKIQFRLVYGASSQEEMLATLRIFLFHFACNIA
ncbi:hypothetical protein RHMOL_Rhmol04G0184500 [Rhododendron molle]|uniref:Uncharacterized protein n=1 Tax=Rhododendron molle TaxID=49168 RepID=A0ACC0P323_RHOML|nr:hypothetical protein RHMOL_Rhmol04G0184500 [Rhododendron molle]